MKRLWSGSFGLAAAALLILVTGVAGAGATEIQRVVTPAGIEVWLVEEHSIPIVAVSFAVAGGSYYDPEGKSGLANLLSATLDEGAGDLDSEAFRARLDDHAIELSFDADRDEFSGKLRTLTENRDEAFRLLRLSITVPRFDDEPVGRMKDQILAKIARDQADPEDVATNAWFEAAFGKGGYGRPVNGTLESVAGLTPDDLRAFHARLFTREHLKIAVVGDIDAAEVAERIDRAFGELPQKSDLEPIGPIEPVTGPKLVTVDVELPQTELRFGGRGLERSDPDFIAAYVMNSILGGSGFSSRLYDEVREKRGLSYSVYSYLYPLRGTGLFIGGAGTRAGRAGQTLDAIRAEIARMAETGPTETELDTAKKYLTGAYPLRFDSNSKIASMLVAIQVEDLGIDYIDRRNGLIEAVTIEDVRRIARELLDPATMIVVAAGSKPSLATLKSGG